MSQGISFAGLASGIDSNQIIDQLVAIERRPINLLQDQQSTLESQLSALQMVNSNLLAVLTQAEALSDPDAFNVFSTTSSDTDVPTASASTNASPGGGPWR